MIGQTFFTGWNFMRWMRLVIGIYLLIEAIRDKDPLLGIFSAFFLFQAIANRGCNGTAECSVPNLKKDPDKIENN